MLARSDVSRLVSTVTPSTSGTGRPSARAVSCADPSAARIMAAPPHVCTVSIRTSSFTADSTALATVVGMS